MGAFCAAAAKGPSEAPTERGPKGGGPSKDTLGEPPL